MTKTITTALLTLLGAVSLNSIPVNATEIQKLSVVEGRAEVLNAKALNIYSDYGITRVELMWPAKSAIELQSQLLGVRTVKCLLFGSRLSVSCMAYDSFGTSWALGSKKTLALTK
ncbi:MULTISPECIES: hypothetical protein [Pseudovibrio]|uniref:hypothetical protein n=1 Tax=Stappiaceae TaxID=2821832 RepID=UPI002365E514|nr:MULTISPECIES: hypothetical protein [Pseudovibrio]MDD7908946.1 hypothetical protein [Pseudovibrio exalbescens]MDX5593733.1 hypothetical protein [Pseudovibrio sp. SPO723]